MPEIRVLPTHLVNKIAAGEVVERPASVLKELVENALDADVSSLDLTVTDGGRKLISVRDDGVGMDAQDLKLAFAPHATSKITSEQDLSRIGTMGFRGEALASIAAVSHAQIVSRRRGAPADSGQMIRAEGEKIYPVRPTAAPEGTTATVRNLFFNTPARRKFMRTVNTEFGHIVDQLARLALPHHRVAFTLTHNGRRTHDLPAAETIKQRARDFFGAELADSLIEFSDREQAVVLYGLIAPPPAARASARWQYFFVNGRYVRDRVLSHALREAYRGLLEPSRAPMALVFIEMDPAMVDVNVHPAKVEVRFRNGHLLHSQLLGAIRDTLNKADLAPAVTIDRAPAEPAGQPDADERRRSLKQALADFFKSQPSPQRILDFPPPRTGTSPSAKREMQPAPTAFERPSTLGPAAQALPGAKPPAEAPSPARPQAIQLHNSYIVTATDEAVAIIDQHALHERIIYEELKRRLSDGALAAQRLLIPQTVEVSESEKALLAERAELLQRLGLDLTEFGPRSLAVQKFPSLLAERKVPVADFIRDLLDVLVEHGSADDTEALLSQALAAMACKAAVKAGDPLSGEEIQALLSRRQQVQRVATCPHGRPTTLTLTLAELERQFKRT